MEVIDEYTQKRNSSIDVFRCLMMFGIVWLHCITQGGYLRRGLDNILFSSVVGFVVISAWFGIRFSWKKVLRIVGIGLYGALIAASVLVVRQESGTWVKWLSLFAQNFVGRWYVWAYVMLMMLSPLLERAIVGCCADKKRLKEILVPLFALVFVWSFIGGLPYIRDYKFSGVEFSDHSGVTLFGIYACVRISKNLGWFNHISRKQLICALPFLALITGIGFYKYNSPFCLAQGVVWFLLLKDVEFSPILKRVSTWLGPSLLSIYVLHTPFMRDFYILERFLVEDLELSVPITHLVSALVVFILATMVDVPRRILVRLAKK